MINLNDITKEIETILNEDVTVRGFMSGKDIELGEFINYDPNRTPWVGVYRGKVNYVPRTLGMQENWEASPSVKVIVQATNLRSAAECEEALEGYVKAIIDAMLKDITLNGSVDIITDFDVEQGYIETDRSSTYFQGATITFNMEVATQ